MSLQRCIAVVALLAVTQRCHGQTYSDTVAAMNAKFGQKSYNPLVRPLLDQTHVIEVITAFELLSIDEVDDISQRFTCNGFVLFQWNDEILTWNASEYGGENVLVAPMYQVWRPRVMLWNTLDERDIFEDDEAPLTVSSGGTVSWVPGRTFPTSCELDMSNFPFDKQKCSLKLVSLDYPATKLKFVAGLDYVLTSFYTVNGEWDLESTGVTAFNITKIGGDLPGIQLTFHIQRKPTVILLSLGLPALFLSFLNLLVFVIPVANGSKIGYGMTVLLALVLSLTFLTRMLPRTSETIPKVTIYLFCLLINSFLTVIDTIIIVFLNTVGEKQREKKEKYAKTEISEHKSSNTSDNNVQDPDAAGKETCVMSPNGASRMSNNGGEKSHDTDYCVIARHLNSASFVIFVLLWLFLTISVIIYLAAS